jgi:hypothetical protein
MQYESTSEHDEEIKILIDNLLQDVEALETGSTVSSTPVQVTVKGFVQVEAEISQYTI